MLNIAHLANFGTSLIFPGTVVNESSQPKPGDAVLGGQMLQLYQSKIEA